MDCLPTIAQIEELFFRTRGNLAEGGVLIDYLRFLESFEIRDWTNFPRLNFPTFVPHSHPLLPLPKTKSCAVNFGSSLDRRTPIKPCLACSGTKIKIKSVLRYRL